jgi:hypothetical protein
MVSHADAMLVLHKWRDEETPLRFDGESPLYSFSVSGVVESEVDSVVKFRVSGSGFIAIHIPPGTRFEYRDPDSMRIAPEDRMGKDHSGEPLKTASGLVAYKPTKEKFLFVEVA